MMKPPSSVSTIELPYFPILGGGGPHPEGRSFSHDDKEQTMIKINTMNIQTFFTSDLLQSEIDCFAVFFVPSRFVKDAFFETVAAGIGLIVVVAEHIPVHDVMAMCEYARHNGVFALGPTTPGILTTGEAKMGIMPGSLFSPGQIGIISRSGSLAYEVAGILTEAGVGQSTVVGMGADPVVFSNMSDILELFERDGETGAVVIVGEVGSVQEENAAKFIEKRMSKPVAAYIAGRLAPEGKRMGHAGAIIRGSTGTEDSKWKALSDVGVEMLETPLSVVDWAKRHGLR